MPEFAIWREAGDHDHYSMRIRTVEESSTCDCDITAMTLEGPIYRGSEIVPSQHTHAKLMVFVPQDTEITYSLTLFYPNSHALKMTQVEVTAVATSTVVEA